MWDSKSKKDVWGICDGKGWCASGWSCGNSVSDDDGVSIEDHGCCGDDHGHHVHNDGECCGWWGCGGHEIDLTPEQMAKVQEIIGDEDGDISDAQIEQLRGIFK